MQDSNNIFEQCPWLRPDWEEPEEDKRYKEELANRDWLNWYGMVMLPAARSNTENLEAASAVGKMLANEGWHPGELTALHAERVFKDFS